MLITQLTATNLRSLDFISITPHSNLNFIIGKNNAGKTSLLEGIYFSSCLKTFKSVPPSSLINKNQKSLKILLNVSKYNENISISTENHSNSPNLSKIDGQRCSVKQLMMSLPVIALNFGTENIVTAGSETHRSMLDWGTFHVEPSYFDVVKDYQKALKQRNALLKKREIANIDYWTALVAELGETLNDKRLNYFIKLNEEFIKQQEDILKYMPDVYDDIKCANLLFKRGWDNNLSLLDALNSQIDKDIILKYTTKGPHRADIHFRSGEQELKNISSMSTQVVTGLLVVMSQAKVFHVEHKDKPVILIDDLFFGIDDKNLRLVINLLVDSDAQCFLTAPDLYVDKIERAMNNKCKARAYEFKNNNLIEKEDYGK